MAAASKQQDQGLPDERLPQLPDFAICKHLKYLRF